HFTEIVIYLNRPDALGITTRLRVKEGQLQSKSLLSPMNKENKFNKIVPKHNLALKVLYESNKIGLKINEILEDPEKLDINRTEIYRLLEKKKRKKFTLNNKINILVLKKLINS